MSNSSINSSAISSSLIQGVQPGNAAISATSVPPGILALPEGTLLKGKVAFLQAGQHAILHTAKGDILIKTELPLQRGQEVVLRLETSSSGVRARIISVDGKSPGELLRTMPQGSSPTMAEAPQKASPTPSSSSPVDIRLSSALPLRAILVSPSDSFSELSQRLNNFIIPSGNQNASGSNFILKLLPQTLRLPVPTVQGMAQNVIEALEQASTRNTSVPTESARIPNVTAPTGTLQSGGYGQSAYQVTKAASDAAPPLPPAILAKGQLAAKIIGTEQSGQAVVKTLLGTLKIDLPQMPGGRAVTLPAGTELNLQLLPANPQYFTQGSTALPSSTPAGILELSHHWHTLPRLFDVLQNLDPTLSEQIRQQLLPSPGPQMAKTMLFFISALRGGNLKDWLGQQPLNRLEQAEHSGLMKRLNSEFQSLRQFFLDPPSPNWQAVFLPVYYDGTWQQVRLFSRRGQAAGGQNGKISRFLVELDLSHFGSIQMDGFLKNHKRPKQFDLVIRSHQPLPDNDQMQIHALFSTATEITGFQGSLNFKTHSSFPNHPMEEIIAHHPNMVV